MTGSRANSTGMKESSPLESGRRTRTVVPRDGALSTVTLPPMRRASRETMARPRPTPSWRRVVEPSAFSKGTKTLSSLFSGMPTPVSRTSKRTTGRRPSAGLVQADLDLALGGELDRVADDVAEELAEAGGVADVAVGELGVDPHGERQPLRGRRGGERRDGVADGLAERERLLGEGDFARLELGEVEDLFDEGEQRFGGLGEVLEVVAALAGGQGRRSTSAMPRMPLSGRAELVADVEEEARLGAAGGLGELAGLAGEGLVADDGGDGGLPAAADLAHADRGGEPRVVPPHGVDLDHLAQQTLLVGPQRLHAGRLAPVAQQERERLADDLLGGEAEHADGRVVDEADAAGLVAQEDAVGGVVEDGAEEVLLVGPLDEGPVAAARPVEQAAEGEAGDDAGQEDGAEGGPGPRLEAGHAEAGEAGQAQHEEARGHLGQREQTGQAGRAPGRPHLVRVSSCLDLGRGWSEPDVLRVILFIAGGRRIGQDAGEIRAASSTKASGGVASWLASPALRLTSSRGTSPLIDEAPADVDLRRSCGRR